ncbi:serine palmitoyltransferase component [Glugoides intestinalis]
MFKEQIKATIRKYGVGTCGPRGFYGTLDIHLTLETKLASIFAKDDAILYSNYFTCVQSIISCFCKTRNNVFVHKKASECIKSGLRLSQAKVYEFDTLEELIVLLKKPEIKDKYLIIERIGKNTGELVSLETLIKLKEAYGFRIILDEAYSIPFIYQEPIDKGLYSKIDLIVGSLCLGYPANGGFCVSCKEAIEYQRLSGAAYVFSASLPAFLAKTILCMLERDIEYKNLREKIQLARRHIKGIISYEKTPILLVECAEIERSYDQLKNEGYVVGRCGEYLRICINEETKEEDLKRIGILLKR